MGIAETCEDDFPYRHAAGVLSNAGYRVSERLDVGGEVFWVPANQKALSVLVGTGWTLRPNARVGVQFVAAQHAGAVGDVKTATADLGDVMSNFWSLAAAIVIR